MSPDLTTELNRVAPPPTRPVDLAWIEAHARELGRRRVVAIMTVSLLCIALGAAGIVVASLSDASRDRTLPVQGPSSSPRGSPEGKGSALVEDISEEQRAEIFAFRAVAAKDLMGPYHKRSYNFSEDDPERTEDGGWRIGFAASDCEPREKSHTCYGLSGEEPQLGNAITDTFVLVRLVDGAWKVTGVEGNMLDDERERLLGYTLPERSEPSHWEFPAADVWAGTGFGGSAMIPIWVGPYPTEAPGSICEVRAKDDDSGYIGAPTVFYEEAPNRPFERAGWVRGTDARVDGASDIEVECRQYVGRGWEMDGQPELSRFEGEVVAVSAPLVWRGDEGFTTPAVCHAILLDEEGQEVWEGAGRAEALWRPGELKDYPYRTTAVVTTRGEPIEAASIGSFDCTSV